MDNELKNENNSVSEQKENNPTGEANQSSNEQKIEEAPTNNSSNATDKPQEVGNNNSTHASGDMQAPMHNAEPMSKQVQASEKREDNKEKKHKLNKRQIIIICVIAVAIIALILGLVLGLNRNKVKSNFLLNSETLTTETQEINLNEKVDVEFKVKDFYKDYGYTVPSTLTEVTVEGKKLDSKNYNYSSGHLSINGEFVTGRITVTAEASAVDFASDSWENLASFSNRGLTDLHIRYGVNSLVGMNKELNTNNNGKLTLRVIGEGHDRLTSSPSDASALTFEIIDFVSDEIPYCDTNPFAYSGSYLRKYCNETIYSQLPAEVQNAIVEVNKTTTRFIDSTYYKVETSKEKIFPLSLGEIGGENLKIDNDLNYHYEETPYQYYQEPRLTKLNEKRALGYKYWLRTPECVNNLRRSTYINENGEAFNRTETDFNLINQTEHLKIIPAFSIGKTKSIITDNWENVSDHANQGLDNLKAYYGLSSFVGLEREIDVDGRIYKVRIIGQNHDKISFSDDSVSALTFEFETPYFESINYSVNAERPIYIYSTSNIRSTLNDSFYNRLPEAVRKGIPLVDKTTVLSGVDGDHIRVNYEVTQDHVFPLSLREIGDVYYCLADPYTFEDICYDYYRLQDVSTADDNDLARMRVKGNYNTWTRSFHCSRVDEICVADSDGQLVNINKGVIGLNTINHQQYASCAPAFNLGRSRLPVTFENDSWENLTYHALFGVDHLKEHYNLRSFIGAHRVVTLNEGKVNEKNYLVRVIGENQDVDVDGKVTALTFEFTSNIVDRGHCYNFEPEKIPNWGKSDLRNYLNNELILQLPSAIADSVKEVKKTTVVYESDDYKTIEQTTEKLFLLSRNEICDYYNPEEEDVEDINLYKQENQLYTYYMGVADFVRAKDLAPYGCYYLRSPSLVQSPVAHLNYVLSVDDYGYLNIHGKSSEALGIAPAFAI